MIRPLMLLCMLIFAVGCNDNQPPCDGPQCDPFLISQVIHTSPIAIGGEVRTASAQPNVNLIALRESKNGGCVNCVQQPRPIIAANQNQSIPIKLGPGEILLSVQPLSQCRPVSQRVQTTNNQMPAPDVFRPLCPDGNCSNAVTEEKEGAFKCSLCGRAAVGREWHEIWSDDGIPLTCMCEQCWRIASPSQRESTIRNYALRSGINIEASPSVQHVLREAASR